MDNYQQSYENNAASLDSIYHLLRFSDLTLLVLAQQFDDRLLFSKSVQQEAPPDLNFKRLFLPASAQAHQLLDVLAERFNLEERPGLSQQQRIDGLRYKLQYHHQTSVLLVEELHLWSDELLIILFKVLAIKPKQRGRLHAVLLAPDDWLEQTSLALQSIMQRQCHVISLLGQEFARLPQQVVLTAKVNEREQQVFEQDPLLADDNNNQGENRVSESTKTTSTSAILGRLDGLMNTLPFHWLLAGGVCVLLVLFVVLQLFSQPQDPTRPSVQSLALPNESDTLVSGLAWNNKKAAPQESQQAHMPPPVKISQTQIKSQKIVEPVATTTTTKRQKKVASLPELAQAVKTEKIDNSMRAQLLRMDGQHYTLQILGLGKEQAMADFYREKKLSNSWYARTQRNGQDWYVFLHGEYNSRADALAAAAKLPRELRSLQPWPRRLEEVKKEIALTAQAK